MKVQNLLASLMKKIHILENHFKKMHAPGQSQGKSDKFFPPTKIRILFSRQQIKKSVSCMANEINKNLDQLLTEFIKYDPGFVYDEITNLINKTNKTGNYPTERRAGILRPL